MVVFRNGIVLHSGLDYLVSSNILTFQAGAFPQTGDVLKLQYRTGCIGAPAHNLLSSLHGDTTATAVATGSMIIGQGSPVRWGALPIGATGRCLVSSGTVPFWGNCRFTDFTNRSIPFTDATGTLTQDNSSFVFDTSSKRLGLGTTSPATTFHLFDSRASVGVTGLTIQAGVAQSTTPLARWLSNAGAELARMDSDGGFVTQRLSTTTTSTRSGWRDLGSTVDPSGRLNGDFWFNSTQQARKSMEAGQTHPLPQVLCSSSGGSTSATALTVLGSCSIPASFLDSGDRLVVQFTVNHTGTASAFDVEMRMAGSTLYSRSLPSTEQRIAFDGSAGLFGAGAAWQIQTYGVSASVDLKVPEFSFSPTSAFTIDFRGRLTTTSADSIAVRNYSVIRYPAQFNP
ncbi:MAG: hypothetical protein NTW74_11770 [Acidobacteria bacterium]|nr:hypothetical protein [Acidobacteriota bacterium]